MKYKHFQLIALFLLGISLNIQAQEAIPASGGTVSNSTGSVSYSIGQMVYTTSKTTEGSVSEGVQQPYEILIVTGINDFPGIQLTCTAYPNPVTDYLYLNIEDHNYKHLSYQLFNMHGNLLDRKKITGNKATVTMATYTPGTYFLKIMQEQLPVKTFKIIKR